MTTNCSAEEHCDAILRRGHWIFLACNHLLGSFFMQNTTLPLSLMLLYTFDDLSQRSLYGTPKAAIIGQGKPSWEVLHPPNPSSLPASSPPAASYIPQGASRGFVMQISYAHCPQFAKRIECLANLFIFVLN